jgi:hypothetical protein
MPTGMDRPEPRTNFGHPVLRACREKVRSEACEAPPSAAWRQGRRI